jgi:hypothetical protein
MLDSACSEAEAQTEAPLDTPSTAPKVMLSRLSSHGRIQIPHRDLGFVLGRRPPRDQGDPGFLAPVVVAVIGVYWIALPVTDPEEQRERDEYRVWFAVWVSAEWVRE